MSEIKINCPRCGTRIDQNEYDSNDPHGSWLCVNCGYGLPSGLGVKKIIIGCDTCSLDEAMMKRYWDVYFDDLEGHIQQLEDEASLLEDSVKKDEMNERIPDLKCRLSEGDIWIDNDVSATPDKWKTLETFTDEAAVKKYQEWNE